MNTLPLTLQLKKPNDWTWFCSSNYDSTNALIRTSVEENLQIKDLFTTIDIASETLTVIRRTLKWNPNGNLLTSK
jgi:hypothetical protein